jgi:integrase
MASVNKDAKGWRVLFVDSNGIRKTIRLSGIPKMNKARAEEIGRYVDDLNGAKCSNGPTDRKTSLWLADVGQNLHEKLASVGLVEPRVSSTLGEFVAGYIERADVSPGTKMNFETVERNLNDYFGADKPIRSVSAADARAFRQWLKDHEKQAENTMRRRCGRARQFFAAAIKAKLIDENPFEGMSVTVNGSTDKERFVTEEEAQKILKACPDLEWRLIFSLCRYGGLRCPSEVLALTWENVLWDSSRIIVTSPKTKRYKGHESRVLPMFPELASVLNEAYEAAFDRREDQSAVVSGPVVTRYRDASQNLRTTFEKIVTRAGLKQWPKPFQNLRSTRETELMEIYPSHVVVAWIGHSEKVARKHYLQTTDAHFEKAVAHQVAHKACEVTQTEKPSKAKDHENLNVFRGPTDACAYLQPRQLPRRDSNPN